MFMVPILSELLSGSSNIIAMVNPIHLLIQVLSYGVPAILIREYSIKWGLGLKGLFILGVAYGAFNEGVLAQTFAKNSNLLGELGSQHFILGLNPYWVIFISIWHAFFAIVFPIFFINFLYPGQDLWLGKKSLFWFLIIICLGVALGAFVGNPYEAIVSTILITILVFFAKIHKITNIIQNPPTSLKPFWIGFMFIFYIVGAIILAKVLGIVLFLIYELFGIWLFYNILKRKNLLGSGSLILFGTGAYVSLAIFVIIILPSPLILLPNLLIIIWVSLFARRVLKFEKQNIETVLVKV